jgi:hypothetical protein
MIGLVRAGSVTARTMMKVLVAVVLPSVATLMLD